MEANTIPSSLCLKSSSFLLKMAPLKTQTFLCIPYSHFLLPRLRATNPSTSSNTENSYDDPITTTTTNNSPARSPPSKLGIKYRKRSRKQAREQQEQGVGGRASPPPKKEWESMSLGEKAVELYMGEKGLLFWLNKFAYASIFIIIGGWILFRFVGPSLGLYQLDTPPLAPTSIFKGSP